MRKYLFLLLLLIVAACEKNNQAKFNYICTSTYQVDPFHYNTMIDTFYGITADAANSIIRGHADSGWSTSCTRF